MKKQSASAKKKKLIIALVAIAVAAIISIGGILFVVFYEAPDDAPVNSGDTKPPVDLPLDEIKNEMYQIPLVY